MTYCVGLRLNQGLVFMSDTRTNAGLDNFSITKKMFTWDVPGDRVITLMTAGNLATTQALVSLLEERSKVISDRSPTILEQPTMFEVARLVGSTLREVISDSRSEGPTASTKFKASVAACLAVSVSVSAFRKRSDSESRSSTQTDTARTCSRYRLARVLR